MSTVQAFAGPLVSPWVFTDAHGWPPRSGCASVESSVPRISDLYLDSSFFLFRTAEEARLRAKIGGSGFAVGKPIEGSEELLGRRHYVLFFVSNRHVVHDGGACIASLNRLDGGAPESLEFDPNEWVPHPGGDDLAAVCAWPHVNSNKHKIRHVQTHYLITKEIIESCSIGIGDEVFMIGRFVNHQGRSTNRNSARFGNLSMMLEDIPVREHGRFRMQQSYAVEMRSRTGFSGSPVALYRTPNTVLDQRIPAGSENLNGLLGVNWGYILDEDGENTWLNGVVPAWKILELLETPELKKKHAHAEDHFRLTHRKRNTKSADDSAAQAFAGDEPAPAGEANPTHLEDFTSLLGAAARKRKQDE